MRQQSLTRAFSYKRLLIEIHQYWLIKETSDFRSKIFNQTYQGSIVIN
jgi:hypothetical protein